MFDNMIYRQYDAGRMARDPARMVSMIEAAFGSEDMPHLNAVLKAAARAHAMRRHTVGSNDNQQSSHAGDSHACKMQAMLRSGRHILPGTDGSCAA